MNVIKPPMSLVSVNKKGNETIFLAGSIEMGAAEDWQKKVTEFYENQPVTLYNPRRDEWDSSWEQDYTSPQFYQQVNWELNALDKANRIIMYFDPNSKSPISLMELGLYATSGKMSVACPKGFWRRGNVEVVCEKYAIPFFDSLDKLLEGG